MKQLAGSRSPRWAFMQKFEIPDFDHPKRNYLTRWRLIQTPWFGIYVHRMNGPDPRATLHDHPWNFVSIILRGGYVEATEFNRTDGPGPHDGFRMLRAGNVNRKRAEDTHTITHLYRTPTWTLMLVGRRRRVWGYADPDGTWTAFDQHRYNDEFEAAMATRTEP